VSDERSDREAPAAAQAPRGPTTPQAILIAGVLVAAAVFFALRQRGPAPAPEASVPAPSASTGGAVSATATSTARASDLARRAQVAAERALEARRGELVAKCAGDAGTVRARGRLEVAFDEQGRQMARGLHVDRSERRHDILQCADAALPPLTIEPLGERSQVVLELTLP
jgi:hypothetical protein